MIMNETELHLITDKQDLFTHAYIQQSLMQLHFKRLRNIKELLVYETKK